MTRVKRLSDGRIFTSPRGAALAYGLPLTSDITACANGYIKEVLQSGWEWVFEEPEELPFKRFPSFTVENILGISDKEYRLYTDVSKRHWPNFLAPFMLKVFSENAEKYSKPKHIREFVEDLNNEIRKKDPLQANLKITQFSRHLGVYEWLYRKAIGLKITLIRKRGHNVKAISCEQIETTSVYDVKVVENIVIPETIRFGPEKGKNAYRPVKLLNSGKTFKSLREAGRQTGINRYQIRHCCEGNLSFLCKPFSDEELVFEYLLEEIE